MRCGRYAGRRTIRDLLTALRAPATDRSCSKLSRTAPLGVADPSRQLTLGLQRDLTGIDLTGRDLTEFYLRGKILNEATLEDAILDKAILRAVQSRGARLFSSSLLAKI
jgi:hypothetical protein